MAMGEKVTLRAMKCPNCGAALKAENGTDTIVCVYCGSSIVPVFEPVSTQKESGFSGVVKVEGIKTSASALAYIEQFFEEYDWDAFAYAHTLSVGEMDKMVASLKVSSADDKNTWIACFKAVAIPYLHKVEGCRRILNAVIEEYRKDSLDAYSKFDAYKRVTTTILDCHDSVLTGLKKYMAAAIKYGATSTEVNDLQDQLDQVRTAANMRVHATVDEIPEVARIKMEKNARIVEQLEARGIHAAQEYQRAQALIDAQHYVEALTILRGLKGYSDAAALVEKLDRYYLISDVLEIEGKLYLFRKENLESTTYNLHASSEGKVEYRPYVKNIANIITNYADLLYFLNGSRRLCRCNLATGMVEVLSKDTFDMDEVCVSDAKVYLLGDKHGNGALMELDMSTGTLKSLLTDVVSVVRLEGRRMVFTRRGERLILCVMDLDTLCVTAIGTTECEVEAFVDNHVVFTRRNPNNHNKTLYVRPLDGTSSATVVEQNIYAFCAVLAGKLFYYVGNARNRSLIHINPNGTGRKEWPLYISQVLFEQGDWVYFIRKAGYNSILCKSRLDGSKFSVIAADIDEFVELKNGYLYYINDDSALVKVRMDGSNLQTLCDDVKKVLTVKEDKVVFVSQDSDTVKSIYAVDFTGSGKIKLAYDVKKTKTYDENAVCYLANGGENLDVLYRLDVNTNRTYKLLEVERIKLTAPQPFPWGQLIWMLISLVLMLICFGADMAGGGFFFLMMTIIAFFIMVSKIDGNTA